MYASDKYREQRLEVLVSAMDDIRFATVVGCTPDDPEVIHVPLLVGSAGDDV